MLSRSLAIALLCGGKSSRFGSDKAMALLQGKPLLQHLCENLSSWPYPLFLATHPERTYDFLNLPYIADEKFFHGPFATLITLFEKTNFEYLVLIACDLAQIQRELLEALFQKNWEAKAYVVQDHQGPQYLFARYSRELLADLKHFRIKGGESFRDFFRNYPTVISYLQTDQEIKNFNTPKEFEEFQCSAI